MEKNSVERKKSYLSNGDLFQALYHLYMKNNFEIDVGHSKIFKGFNVYLNGTREQLGIGVSCAGGFKVQGVFSHFRSFESQVPIAEVKLIEYALNRYCNMMRKNGTFNNKH